MDIAAMLLWMVTVAAGVYLLAAGRPARRPADPAPAIGSTGAAQASGVPRAAGVPQAGAIQIQAGATYAGAPRTAGVPKAAATAYAAGAAVPPITHTRITTQPGEHPLLEFMHPALGVAGLGCWIAFVITRFSVFAWAAFGVIVVTIVAGLTWYAVNARAAKAARSGREPGVSGDSTLEPGMSGDSTLEPGAAEPGTREPGATEPSAVEPSVVEPSVVEPSVVEPSVVEPGATKAGAAGGGVHAPARRYPARRLLVHGSGAAVTFVLALVTALAAHHV